MLELSTKQGEAGFARIKARFPKQSVQYWMPERLNTKPLGREKTRDTQEFTQTGDWLKHDAQTEFGDTRVKKIDIYEGNS